MLIILILESKLNAYIYPNIGVYTGCLYMTIIKRSIRGINTGGVVIAG